jgi:RNA polymerase sigma-70 factor (ECF subfamily)
MGDSSHAAEDDRFVELVAKNQVKLRTYICTLVRDRSVTDDLLQEANLALWKNRTAFDSNRDFISWACGMALIAVLRYRRKVASDKLLFDEALLNTLTADFIEQVEDWELRERALSKCLKKLSVKDRWLLETRYSSGVTTAQIAQQLGRPLSTVYSSLARIREALFRCMQMAIAQESHPSM